MEANVAPQVEAVGIRLQVRLHLHCADSRGWVCCAAARESDQARAGQGRACSWAERAAAYMVPLKVGMDMARKFLQARPWAAALLYLSAHA